MSDATDDDFPWEQHGLSANPTVRYGQLSTCCTTEAIIWAVRGEKALREWLAGQPPRG